jgi:hypothetical protein
MEYRADISEVALPKESEPKAEQDNVPPKDLA